VLLSNKVNCKLIIFTQFSNVLLRGCSFNFHFGVLNYFPDVECYYGFRNTG
jgi:hypothetical protein